MPVLEEKDDVGAYDASSQHIGKTKAVLQLRPVPTKLSCFPWAFSDFVATDIFGDTGTFATDAKGFDMARRNAFVHASESVSGAGRFKFFRYGPISYTNCLNAFPQFPTFNGDYSGLQEDAATSERDRDALTTGKFELLAF
ncbi:hypothetical protein, conserved [Eimeria tenella]|uniref:Uncharacterized protein n=1 Tax=Eimeria tenella TaxID=5802 RepID=U6KVN1_EIMTE|nr:hypothetical protein, conserved [Eimeria tenella]CDJ40973.1 hypothetical protein, conserved [Eimeria tenella]|eukprot:XP_013231723.1 hypothetical protein, conserved [Eimeria tenella]